MTETKQKNTESEGKSRVPSMSCPCMGNVNDSKGNEVGGFDCASMMEEMKKMMGTDDKNKSNFSQMMQKMMELMMDKKKGDPDTGNTCCK